MRPNPIREVLPQRRHNYVPPRPVPMLGQLQRGTPRVWAYCEGLSPAGEPCLHKAPLALAPFIIRWGRDASSDFMRKRLRCAVCGHRGACLHHPSWIDAQVGFQAFPAE